MNFDPLKPFILEKLPPKGLDLNSPKFTKALIKARAELAELKGYSQSLPNPLLLLSPAVIKDALASSEIENIVTTMMEVLQNQVFEESEQRNPDKEVLRYREAVLFGFDELQKGMPITSRIIKGTQERLFPNHTGAGYRVSQNKLENPKTKEVVFTPPAANEIPNLISDLEVFLNEESPDIDPLIKNAIAHYQFEAIHPFGDGNGRTGRILMVLYLVQQNILLYPILFISDYFNKSKPEYYKHLISISTSNTWEEYILYVLEGFYEQAKKTKLTILQIMTAFYEYKSRLKKELPKIYSTELVERLFAYPIVTPVKLGKELGVHYTTASRYLKALMKAGFLEDMTVGKYHLYSNTTLMKILNS